MGTLKQNLGQLNQVEIVSENQRLNNKRKFGFLRFFFNAHKNGLKWPPKVSNDLKTSSGLKWPQNYYFVLLFDIFKVLCFLNFVPTLDFSIVQFPIVYSKKNKSSLHKAQQIVRRVRIFASLLAFMRHENNGNINYNA